MKKKKKDGLIVVEWQKSKTLNTITTETIFKYISGKFRTGTEAKY